MIQLLLDADAYNFARKLSLLSRLLGRAPSEVRLVLTGYIARYELSSLQEEINGHVRAGLLSIMDLERRGDANVLFKSVRGDGIDKGESEAIAWVLLQAVSARPILISCDTKAIAVAKKRGLSAGDLLDLALLLVRGSLATIEEISESLSVWAGPGFGLGKPRDYASVREALKQRKRI